MVFYCLKSLLKSGAYPTEMIDHNVRIDYGKLRHLVVLDRQLNDNFGYLRKILETRRSAANIVSSFPVEHLTKPSNFISLLFYFGLLSYTATHELTIPNHTVNHLLCSYLRDGYEDVDVFSVDLWHFAELMWKMAYNGEWDPVFRFLADEVKQQTSIRDYLTGEKVIQTFLLAYLNVTDYYLTRTEEEMGKGFADLYLEPFWQKYKDVAHSYLIELKYLTRTECTDELVEAQVEEAEQQLQQYAADQRVRRRQHLTCLILVFSGWELKTVQEC